MWLFLAFYLTVSSFQWLRLQEATFPPLCAFAPSLDRLGPTLVSMSVLTEHGAPALGLKAIHARIFCRVGQLRLCGEEMCQPMLEY